MIRGSSCGTWPRSGTPPASPRPAEDQPVTATSNTTSPTRQAAGRACATARLPAVTTTGSSSTRSGRSSRSRREPSSVPPPPAGNTPPNPPGTRSSRHPRDSPCGRVRRRRPGRHAGRPEPRNTGEEITTGLAERLVSSADRGTGTAPRGQPGPRVPETVSLPPTPPRCPPPPPARDSPGQESCTWAGAPRSQFGATNTVCA